MKKFLTVLLVVLIWIVTFESVSWLAYSKLAPASGQKNISDLLNNNDKSFSTGTRTDQGLESISEAEILPYYLYRNKPFSGIERQQINSEGYRNGTKEFGKKEKGKIRILAIGGSTTYGWLIKDYEQAWPAQLEAILNKKFNGQVEVINAGLPGGMSPELLVAFMLKDQYLDADIIIFHNGGNDAVPLFYKDYYPDYRYHRAINAAEKLRKGEKALIKNSHFFRLLYAFWLKDSSVSQSIRPEPEQKLSVQETAINVKKNQPIGFERNMETMIKIAKEQKTEIVIFPFHLARKEIYKIIPKDMRYTEKIHDSLQLGIEKNKAVLRALSKKYNLHYYEMPQDQIPLQYFFDHCHLTAQGDRMKAEFISKGVEEVIKKRISH